MQILSSNEVLLMDPLNEQQKWTGANQEAQFRGDLNIEADSEMLIWTRKVNSLSGVS